VAAWVLLVFDLAKGKHRMTRYQEHTQPRTEIASRLGFLNGHCRGYAWRRIQPYPSSFFSCEAKGLMHAKTTQATGAAKTSGASGWRSDF
jgi:hypothetical protein